MTPDDFVALRKALGLSQKALGIEMGMSLRAVQEIEAGTSPLRTVHALAVERIALAHAAQRREPMLATVATRREAIQVSQDILGVK